MFIFVCALKCRGQFLKQKRDNVITAQNEQWCRMSEYKMPTERINVGCISGQLELNVIVLCGVTLTEINGRSQKVC